MLAISTLRQRKESRETLFWLRSAVDADIAKQEEVAWERREAGELRAMIIAAIKTAQSNPDRGGASKEP